MHEYKVIQDPVNGPVRFDGPFLEIIDTPEFQRLRYIRQLGLCYLVFPGANHTRFEHSVGTYYLARAFADHFALENRLELEAAALLHDIGHPPFSHSVEPLFREWTGMDHEEAGRRIVLGEEPFADSQIPGILEAYGIDRREVAAIMSADPGVPYSSLVSGPIDVDEMDYLRRDSLMCGVSTGSVDYRRIMEVLEPEDGRFVVEEKGLPAIESLLINRILMYRSVYFHKTCRIAQGMLNNALRSCRDRVGNVFRLTDAEIMESIPEACYREITGRRLFKAVVRIRYSGEDLSRVKSAISSMSEGDYVLDIIPPLEFSGPSRVKSTINIRMGGDEVPITEVSPLVRSLMKSLEDRYILVATRDGISVPGL